MYFNSRFPFVPMSPWCIGSGLSRGDACERYRIYSFMRAKRLSPSSGEDEGELEVTVSCELSELSECHTRLARMKLQPQILPHLLK